MFIRDGQFLHNYWSEFLFYQRNHGIDSPRKSLFKHMKFNLQNFKTSPCPVCPPSQSQMLHCSFYHSPSDSRRIPVVYHPVFLWKDPKQCLNMIQYWYHPKIYKTQKCGQRSCKFGLDQQLQKCPFYHNQSQRRERQQILGDPAQQLLQQNRKQVSKQTISKSLRKNKKLSQKESEKLAFFSSQNLFQKYGLQPIIQTICAMANTQGGSIFIGISHEGKVVGQNLTPKEIDSFQLNLDEMLRKFVIPTLNEDMVSLKIHNLEDDPSLIVLQLSVKKKQIKNLLSLEKMFFVRKGAKTYKLSGRQVISAFHILTAQNKDLRD